MASIYRLGIKYGSSTNVSEKYRIASLNIFDLKCSWPL